MQYIITYYYISLHHYHTIHYSHHHITVLPYCNTIIFLFLWNIQLIRQPEKNIIHHQHMSQHKQDAVCSLYKGPLGISSWVCLQNCVLLVNVSRFCCPVFNTTFFVSIITYNLSVCHHCFLIVIPYMAKYRTSLSFPFPRLIFLVS